MKPTGIVRRIDDLGRVVIPQEVRRILRINDGDPIELYLDGDAIALRKYYPMEDSMRAIKNVIEFVECDAFIEENRKKKVIVALRDAIRFLDPHRTENWTDLLPLEVATRLADCNSRKSDILPLAQAKWASIKNDPDFTKEDALVQVLELLDCNSQFFDLTRDEYVDILKSII